MSNSQLPSQLLENAVSAFTSLPGVGRKSALRLALHLLKQTPQEGEEFANAIAELCSKVKYCQCCHNISDSDICSICDDTDRDHTTVCVVESIKEVMLIENTQQYKGVYHVLGGVISPMNSIAPSDLSIASLIERAAHTDIKEIILALSPNMEGDTTCFYLYRKLADVDINITTIARGIAFGDDLEYADEIPLGRSILNRVIFNNNL